MASNLIDDAIAVGTLGMAAEKAQELADAKTKYSEAAGLFLAAMRAEAHPQRAQLLKCQALDFLERAEGVAARLKDASDPLLGEARKLEAAAEAEADCEGDFMRAKSLHAQAIERYLELLKLEPPGTPRYESLRREAEGCFARAEKVAAVLRARERDVQRQPLDRAAQLEQAARESQQRGEIERAFTLYRSAIEGLFVLHGTPLWDQEASPLASKCLEACEALKRSGHAPPPLSSTSSGASAKGTGSGGGGGAGGMDHHGGYVNEDEVEATLADGVSSVRYPSSFAAPYSFQDLVGVTNSKDRKRAPPPCLAFLIDNAAAAAMAKKSGTEQRPVLVLGSRLLPLSKSSPSPPPPPSDSVLGNSSAVAPAPPPAAPALTPAPAAEEIEEECPLPYGGDLQAAMRAQDRPAIKRIMAHNKKTKANRSGIASSSNNGGGSGGGGSEDATKSTGKTTPSAAASGNATATANNRGAGITALARGLKRLLLAQPHRDCAVESFMLRTRRSHRSSGSAAAAESGADADITTSSVNTDVEEEAIFVFQAPPPGAVTLAEWLSGGSTGGIGGGAGGGGQTQLVRSSAAQCRRQGHAGFEALRGLLRGLLTDLQLLHAAGVYGALSRVAGVWVGGGGQDDLSQGDNGNNGVPPYAVLCGLPSLDPRGATDLDGWTNHSLSSSSSGGSGSSWLRSQTLTQSSESVLPAGDDATANAHRAYRATAAPELLQATGSSTSSRSGSALPFTAASDVYQWASVAFWALTGAAWATAAAEANSGVVPPLPPSLPLAAELSDLLGDALCKGLNDPSRRLSVRDALRHPFLNVPLVDASSSSSSSSGLGLSSGVNDSNRGDDGSSSSRGGSGNRTRNQRSHRGRGAADESDDDHRGGGSGEDEDDDDDKVVALQQVCALLRQTNASTRFFVAVQRSSLVDTTIAAFQVAEPKQLLRKMSVKFLGEDGIDAGGLTKELYRSFFTALTSGDCALFECDLEAPKASFLPAKEDESLTSAVGGRDPLLASYEAIGRVLGKAILDGQPLAANFHPILFRALLLSGSSSSSSSSGLTASLHDLDAYSPAAARSCRQLLAAEDVSTMGMCFDDDDGGMEVTPSNVKSFVRKRATKTLLQGRAQRLDALRKGFKALPLLPHLRLFSVFELMAVVCGSQTLDAATLLERIEFRGFRRSSSTPQHLKHVLRSFSDQQRLQFVSFVTASAALPPRLTSAAAAVSISSSGDDDDDDSYGGGGGSSTSEQDLRGMLVVQAVDWPLTRFPLAHTCFNRLDLPEYGDEATLRNKLTWCLENLEMAGFGEA